MPVAMWIAVARTAMIHACREEAAKLAAGPLQILEANEICPEQHENQLHQSSNQEPAASGPFLERPARGKQEIDIDSAHRRGADQDVGRGDECHLGCCLNLPTFELQAHRCLS